MISQCFVLAYVIYWYTWSKMVSFDKKKLFLNVITFFYLVVNQDFSD
jgi:hypothetical protein